MNALTIVHVAAGAAAIASGAVAVWAGKGGRLHARAGNAFAAAMMAMGLTAALLVLMRDDGALTFPGGSLLVCYLVATGWWAAHRRDGVAGRFEIGACFFAAAVAVAAFGLTALAPRGPETGQIAFAGALAALAAAFDLTFILRKRLTGAQRLRRHLWRMCTAFFFATGAFFLGQQDVMPAAMRGSLWLFVPAFAPIGFMFFWIARLALMRALRRGARAAGTLFERPASAGAAAPGGL